MLDIYETLPLDARDDKVALVYEMNKENYVAGGWGSREKSINFE